MTSLSGKRALITGASRRIGIGAATCRALAHAGADIAFTHWTKYDTGMYGSSADEPAELVAELRAIGVRAEAIEFDLSASDAGTSLFDDVETRLGAIDILVNNAAFSTHDNWETLTAESFDSHSFVNARGTALLSVEMARRFTKDAGGRIINFSSGQHLGPMPDELSYAMSKGVIIAFSQSIAPDLARRGITINVVNPGPTDTGWMTPEIESDVIEKTPSGRVGTPEDVARLISWLVSDDAAWITGQVINSEGGFIRG
ncbi:MAG: SDR family oxidoreductase [Thermomicrobiales bacterium]